MNCKFFAESVVKYHAAVAQNAACTGLLPVQSRVSRGRCLHDFLSYTGILLAGSRARTRPLLAAKLHFTDCAFTIPHLCKIAANCAYMGPACVILPLA